MHKFPKLTLSADIFHIRQPASVIAFHHRQFSQQTLSTTGSFPGKRLPQQSALRAVHSNWFSAHGCCFVTLLRRFSFFASDTLFLSQTVPDDSQHKSSQVPSPSRTTQSRNTDNIFLHAARSTLKNTRNQLP